MQTNTPRTLKPTAPRALRTTAIVLLGLATVWMLPAVSQAQVDKGNDAVPSQMSVSDVFAFGTQNPIAAASSVLHRTNHSMSATIRTRGLSGGHAYTVWWVIFDDPDRCVDGCGPDDLSNPAVNATVMWAAGSVADQDGFATFQAHAVPGRPEGFIARGTGMFNTHRAEVHMLVRDHGIVGSLGATLLEQITTTNAGCDPRCTDVQSVIHLR